MHRVGLLLAACSCSLIPLSLLASCGVSTRAPAIKAKQQAPDFELPDEQGNRVRLGQLTAKGPAVLVFYRGYW